MPWINPLDRMPQIPQDWANHISQGGLWSCAMIAVELAATGAHMTALALAAAAFHAFVVMAAVSVTKKVVDYIKEGEPWQVCVGKAIVTVLWPASLLLISVGMQHG